MSKFPTVHDLKSPYPQTSGDYVFTDELCQCGARRSEHMDTVAYGHGAFPPNNCTKFSFKKFVMYKRAA